MDFFSLSMQDFNLEGTSGEGIVVFSIMSENFEGWAVDKII